MNADLESFLKEVGAYVAPTKEATLFAIGGRGYYENPASDLLAFFLKPDAEHGLKDLFLSTFLECVKMKEDYRKFNLSYVDIKREVPTDDNKRIDLQILGVDWCLLIENKIYHWQANPFPTYEAHAKRLREKTVFSILSPDGQSEAKGWSGVSYKSYCQALRERMAAIFFTRLFSKWHIFAREFILHMENELYIPPMKPEQVAFVEKHAAQIAEVQKLATQYQSFILQEVKRCLNDSLLGHIFDTRDEAWAFRCTSPQWGNNDMVLIKPNGNVQKFFIRAYLEDRSEPRLSKTMHALKHMLPDTDGQYPYWTSATGFDSAEEAIAELCQLAKTISGLVNKSDSTP
ncbi:MAG TPA: PD-(D/E)XK nuclease family protein [Verrucomicrobiae bacterium]